MQLGRRVEHLGQARRIADDQHKKRNVISAQMMKQMLHVMAFMFLPFLTITKTNNFQTVFYDSF
jgi:hypothetical protein